MQLFSYKNSIFLLISLIISILISIFVIKFEYVSFRVFEYAHKLGYFPDIYYNWIIGLLVGIFFTTIISLFNNKHYLNIWLIKLFVTLIFMLLYEYKYSLDSYMYFSRAIYIDKIGFFYNATDNIIYFTRLLTYFFGESYYSTKIVYSFLGFLGVVFIYKAYLYVININNIKTKNELVFMYILFLFPSILFWSSTLGKDSLTLFFVGIFLLNLLKVLNCFNKVNIIFIIIAIIGVYFIRPWWAIIFIGTIILYNVNIKSKKQILFILCLTPVFYYIFQKILEQRGLESVDHIFNHMYLTATQMSKGNSSVEINDISTLVGYIYYYLPNLFTTLFRPMIYEVTNIFMLISSIENIILLYFVAKYIVLRPLEIIQNRHLKIMILFVFVWSLIYVVISPTNLGVAVRFKLQVLPILLVVIFIVRSIVLEKVKNIV